MIPIYYPGILPVQVSAVIAGWSNDENHLTCGAAHQSQTIMRRRSRSPTGERGQNAERTSNVKVMHRDGVTWRGALREAEKQKS